MIRSFMAGNVLIGLFIGTISTIVFGILHFPFFYFIGFISGFLSLIPYLGVLLAMAPPIIAGIGPVESGAILGAVVTVLGMHLVALNVLYPKFLGNRLQLNPLTVTIALLVWGWLWGAVGLVLAIPITAAAAPMIIWIERITARLGPNAIFSRARKYGYTGVWTPILSQSHFPPAISFAHFSYIAASSSTELNSGLANDS